MRHTSTTRGFFAAAVAAFAALGMSASNVDAGFLTYNLNKTNFGGASPAGSGPWATINFVDGTLSSTSGVYLTITNKLKSTSEFINDFYFNMTAGSLGAITKIDTSAVGGDSYTNFNVKLNSQNAPGDGSGSGYHDIILEIPPPLGGGGDQFTKDEVLKFFIAGMTASQFKATSVTEKGGTTSTGVYFGAKVQGIDGTPSSGFLHTDGGQDDDGFFGPSSLEEVPAPPAVVLAVMGVGLFGFVGRRLRRPAVV